MTQVHSKPNGRNEAGMMPEHAPAGGKRLVGAKALEQAAYDSYVMYCALIRVEPWTFEVWSAKTAPTPYQGQF